MRKFDWDYIHSKCDLNQVRDELWAHSRFYGLRFTYIIKMIEDKYYFESLLLLIMLLEQVLSSKTGQLSLNFESLINACFLGEKRNVANKLRDLRNKIAHRYLFKYFVSFDEKTEYPLSDLSNYEIILNKLFLPIISCFDDRYNETIDFSIGEYTINDLAQQYGIQKELEIMTNLGINNNMSKEVKEKIAKENINNIMRLIDNTSPVDMFETILKSLF